MGQILLYILLVGAGLSTLVRPWIGIFSYYFFSILGPQYIWWWNFEGLRSSLIIAVSTSLGVFFQFASGNYENRFIFNRSNFFVFSLWFFITVSYFLGPFSLRSINPTQGSYFYYMTNVIFVFYFFSVSEINTTQKVKKIVLIFIISMLYLTYWANLQYLNQNWWQFNYGRLMGPFSIDGSSIYKDENSFAMFFVSGTSFLYYFGWSLKNKIFRWALWCVIPLAWHAVFLTSSRGGVVGLGVVMLTIILLSNKKLLALPLLLSFFLFYQWQAGDVMKSRTDTISSYEVETSAQMRIAAWEGGARMVMEFPLTGVGMDGFREALPLYSETEKRVAHNTFVQFTAESGIFAGCAYLVIAFLFFKNFITIRKSCLNLKSNNEKKEIELFNNATFASFCGYFVCSMFLSLNRYEIYFVLLMINNSLFHICTNKKDIDELKHGGWHSEKC